MTLDPTALLLAIGVAAVALARRTIHGLCERNRHGALADAGGTGEQQALRHAPAKDGLLEQLDDVPVADDHGVRS